jgi:hypothetical protein
MLREPSCEYRFDVFFNLSPDLRMGLSHVQLHSLFLDIIHVALDVGSLPLFGDD